MTTKPNLLVKDNLVRHIVFQVKRLDELTKIKAAENNHLFRESFLATVISCFEAALLDTMREYVYANPDEIYEIMINGLDKKVITKDKNQIRENGFAEYLLETYLAEVAYADNKEKIKKLEKLTGVKVDLGNERWERILETIARRNCFIHNDLIVNNTYFFQAGQKAESIEHNKRLSVTGAYLCERIKDIKDLLLEVKKKLTIKYKHKTNVVAVKELWDYVFENHYPLIFENCWNTEGNLITYIGPKPNTLIDSVSPRTVALFSAWMSFFGYAFGGDLKYFSTIFYNNSKDRELYSTKLKYLMDAFEKVDFQGFKVQVYDKKTLT